MVRPSPSPFFSAAQRLFVAKEVSLTISIDGTTSPMQFYPGRRLTDTVSEDEEDDDEAED